MLAGDDERPQGAGVGVKPWPGKVGEAWRIAYQPDNPNNRTLHIRAIVDEVCIVCAIHSRRRGWGHVIEYRVVLDRLFEDRKIKRSRARFPI